MGIEDTKIISAQEARKIIEEAKAERMAKEAKRKKEYEDKCKAVAMERLPGTLKAISEIIEEAAKQEKTSVDIVLWERMVDNINNIPWTDINYIKDPLGKFLFDLGYTVTFSWYSISYAASTGKYADIKIEW